MIRIIVTNLFTTMYFSFLRFVFKIQFTIRLNLGNELLRFGKQPNMFQKVCEFL